MVLKVSLKKRSISQIHNSIITLFKLSLLGSKTIFHIRNVIPIMIMDRSVLFCFDWGSSSPFNFSRYDPTKINCFSILAKKFWTELN